MEHPDALNYKGIDIDIVRCRARNGYVQLRYKHWLFDIRSSLKLVFCSLHEPRNSDGATCDLGLFMALQPKIISCGKRVATFAMAVRFLTGPAVIAATSIAIGLRGVLLHVAIVQVGITIIYIVLYFFLENIQKSIVIILMIVKTGMCD